MNQTIPKQTEFQAYKSKRDAEIYSEFRETEGAKTKIVSDLAHKHGLTPGSIFKIIRAQKELEQSKQ